MDLDAKTCSIDGCDRSVKARGWCGTHYQRWYSTGQLTLATTEDRFWRKVKKTDDCWLWTGALNYEGYGMFTVASEHIYAHRYSFEVHKGPIPDGLVIDHVCHSQSDCPPSICEHRRCVNPHHLEAVEHAENCRRGVPRHCKNGHPFDEENTGYRVRRGWRSRVCMTCQRENGRRSKRKRRAAR